MEKVLTKQEFMELVYKDIERKENVKKGTKGADQHIFDNFCKIRRRMNKYKSKYRRYD